MDESNVLDSSFLERMNTLLANGEVPGLFEGDEMTTLMTQCKEGAQRDGLMLDSQEELYKWFTQQVSYYYFQCYYIIDVCCFTVLCVRFCSTLLLYSAMRIDEPGVGCAKMFRC